MFGPIQEDSHDCPRKGKPRLPKSQGCMSSNNSSIGGCTTLRLSNQQSNSRSTNNNSDVIISPAINDAPFNSVKSTASASPLFEDAARIKKRVIKPTLPDIEIVPATIREYRRIAKTLCLAFEKDPFVNYILNTSAEPANSKEFKRKRELMLSFFEFQVYECFTCNGSVYVIKDINLEKGLTNYNLKISEINKLPFLGAALWNQLEFNDTNRKFEYPDATGSSLIHFHPSSLKFNLFSTLAKCRLKILKEKFPLLFNKRDEVLNDLRLSSIDSVWYLDDLGVIPDFQGYGLAKKIVNHCMDNFVNVLPNAWCYLESSNLANRVFYQKLGFVVSSTFVINENDSVNDDHLIYMDAMFKYPAPSKYNPKAAEISIQEIHL